jgi:hypothetical protein
LPLAILRRAEVTGTVIATNGPAVIRETWVAAQVGTSREVRRMNAQSPPSALIGLFGVL